MAGSPSSANNIFTVSVIVTVYAPEWCTSVHVTATVRNFLSFETKILLTHFLSLLSLRRPL
jgi:hypothetical protein